MKKVLICGDSFAADWTVKYPGEGWPNLLAKEFNVTNIAQAGCCEYKIYKQLLSQDLDNYDAIIVSHTSAFRIYIDQPHPIHYADPLHKNSDLIFTDLEEHSKTNNGLKPILEYFTKFYSLEYAEFTHELLCEKICTLLKTKPAIHITNSKQDCKYKFKILNFYDVFLQHRGLLNHFNDEGNCIVFKKINQEINQLMI